MLYRFQSYELDLHRLQLKRGHLRIRLTGAPLDLLILLVERRGALLKRAEIADRLWSEPELVDVDQGINTAIRRIREALRDDPSRPRFIETVVGKGYRFVAEVELVAPATPTTSPAPAPPAPQPDRVQSAIVAAASTATVPQHEGSVPVGVAYPEAGNAPAPAPMRSRKGVWTAALAVVLAGIALAWLLLRGPQDKVRLGGTLRQVTFNDQEERVTAAALSPDGKWIVYADLQGISLHVLENQTTVGLKSPPHVRAEKFAWFPGQTSILLSGFNIQAARPQIWTVSVTGGEPKLFLDDAHNGVPSPNGAMVAFTTNGDRELWIAGSAGEGARRLGLDASGKAYTALFWSSDAKRIGYVRQANIVGKQDSYESVDAQSGKLLASEKSISFESAYAVVDGRLYLLRDSAEHYRNAYSLWEVNTDQATGRFISQPRRLAVLSTGRALNLSAANDGARVCFVLMKGNPHIYVAKLHPGPAIANEQRLTFDTQTDYPHGWLRDNETVVFESNRTGSFRLYKERLQDHLATGIPTGNEQAVLPQVTPDGKWILYAVKPHLVPSPEDLLYRVPVDGGTPEPVPLDKPLEEFACSKTDRGLCVLRESTANAFLYYALDAVHGKGPELGRTAWLPHVMGDWGVAPDGSAVALTIHDAGNPSIRIVPLGGDGTRREQEVAVTGFGQLSGINWSPDGRGWYVATTNAVGTALLFVSQQGKAHLLRDSVAGGWAVPSPDGSKLALVDQPVDSNVWMWQMARGESK
jgi:DNA-binding winged helix-turn-helix (wHTH) protein/Tol biopolymer transport system component